MRASRITTAAMMLAAGTASAVAATSILSPSEIKATFGTGKPFSAVSASGQSAYWFTFYGDGHASAVPKGRQRGTSGHWRVSSRGYCTQWARSTEHCYTVEKRGRSFEVRNASGNLVARWTAPAARTTATASSTTTATSSTSRATQGRYADGTYTGPVVNAYYGLMQIQAIIRGGRLTSVNILRYPSDRSTSVFINRQALPLLRDEVISAQSAHVDIVSGATLSSHAFIRSLGAAMNRAKL